MVKNHKIRSSRTRSVLVAEERDYMTVKVLPPNTTSKLQPLDQGIIRSFKVVYGAQIMRRLLDSTGEGKPCSSINILQQLIRMADYAWRNVAETTIKNCLIEAGFSENKNF
ncbi:hypothetical protein AVEN_28-1 [Araneus ventricosus]|uniref:DDE-1 domain-containing protein n=1 Tax=Araneus ventricosus TaxID=182803 RepID=A0A4Y2RK58_ARAVE|nr:hypothetical protein AVEN_28-1 [Araneus ventricosus]